MKSPLPEIAPLLTAKMAGVAEFDAGEMARPDGREDITSGTNEISFQSGGKLFVIFQSGDDQGKPIFPNHFCFVKAKRRFPVFLARSDCKDIGGWNRLLKDRDSIRRALISSSG